jgi:hypothetical protein
VNAVAAAAGHLVSFAIKLTEGDRIAFKRLSLDSGGGSLCLNQSGHVEEMGDASAEKERRKGANLPSLYINANLGQVADLNCSMTRFMAAGNPLSSTHSPRLLPADPPLFGLKGNAQDGKEGQSILHQATLQHSAQHCSGH